MENVLIPIAGVGSAFAIYFSSKSNWQASSLFWNIVASLLWFSIYFIAN